MVDDFEEDFVVGVMLQGDVQAFAVWVYHQAACKKLVLFPDFPEGRSDMGFSSVFVTCKRKDEDKGEIFVLGDLVPTSGWSRWVGVGAAQRRKS